ncbi:MAG: hypothetical protein A3J83_05800, partial [Elusimicrobia bacterium RIFOXYA2_FULL_40_6]
KTRIGKYFTGYKSKYDSTLQPYTIDVPDNYDKNTKYPLLVNLHGFGGDMAKFNVWNYTLDRESNDNPQSTTKRQYIKVQVFGRGNVYYHMLGERDVFDVVAEIRKAYNIDSDRIYLDGFSMGGGGTWYLGLRHPDFWAAICPRGGVTKAFRNFSGDLSVYTKNAMNLPVYCIHGDKDTTVPIEHSRKMVGLLKEYGYNVTFVEEKGLSHECSDQAMQKRLDWLLSQKKVTTPKHVRFVCDSLSANKAYWLSVLSIQDYSKMGEIEAEIVNDAGITVKTNNIDRFLVDIPPEMVMKAKNITVTVDGASKIEVNTETNMQAVFSKNSQGQWVLSGGIYLDRNKKPGVCGPIAEVFNDSFIFVYGKNLKDYATGERDALTGKEWGQMFGDFTVKADNEVTADDIKKANLILYGDASNNILTKRYLESRKIPERLSDAGDSIFVIPNPENPEKLVCISTVMNKNSSLVKIINRNPGDYTVYKTDDKGNYELLQNGYFNSGWK